MPAKIATAEDVQAELRTLLAMTEEEAPSRAKMAAAIGDLATRVAGGKSLTVRIQRVVEDWANQVGMAVLKDSQGVTFEGIQIEGKVIVVKFSGARDNRKELHMSYFPESQEVIGVILGSIEGHKIKNLRFSAYMFDEPEEIASKFSRALGRYIEENSL
jgi:hypothetical protein